MEPHVLPSVSPSPSSVCDGCTVEGQEKKVVLVSSSSSSSDDVVLCSTSPGQRTFDQVGLGKVVECVEEVGGEGDMEVVGGVEDVGGEGDMKSVGGVEEVGGEGDMKMVGEDVRKFEMEQDLDDMVGTVEEDEVEVVEEDTEMLDVGEEEDMDEVKMEDTMQGEILGVMKFEKTPIKAKLSDDSVGTEPAPLVSEDYHFDADWLLNSMADDVSFNGSYHESPPRPISRHTSSQPPPSHHTSTSPPALVSLSQTPASPVRGRASFITPASVRGRRMVDIYSDDNITPMPPYHAMQTPQLKGECSKFGVRVIPKRKMIAKLREIYTYTHPLVGGCHSILTMQV